MYKIMKVELNKSLENPTAFFNVNGKLCALDLVEHTARWCDENGGIDKECADLDFDVNQNWDDGSTKFKFDGFTIIYSGDELTAQINH